MKHVSVDFSAASCGPVRPLHGVNSGPMTKVFTYDARPQFLEAGFPFARLHDVEYPYGSGEFVDINCLFRDFDADETKPESYNFGLTDLYVKACVEVGAEPLFRLGPSIEHAPIKRHIYPPKDYEKWARVCEHIIRHYTEGWADGFHYNIRYWEIWNEADGSSRNQWQGTPEAFYELYCVAATHLKGCFPHLKIGGCGWTKAHNEFIEGFFKYITAKPWRVPLDFYSWHRYYADLSALAAHAAKADELLQRYGYADAESVFDEWNYMEDWRDQPASYVKLKGHIGAAQCAATLAYLQSHTSVTVANYFEADVVKEWCGIFEVDKMFIGTHGKASVRPLKPFYAFKSFNALYRMGQALPALCEGENLYATAAKGEQGVGLLLSHYTDEADTVSLTLKGVAGKELEIRVVDEANTFTKLFSFTATGDLQLTLPVAPYSYYYIGTAID
ncbi:MAG: hypothetical protein E7650_03705 [Ruminococcaceae bacterium]|nr:hypothetical protein [Oscillospiraceae bacterium]